MTFFKPRLQQLEGREVPAIVGFVVNTEFDTPDANPADGVPIDSTGMTSLRAVTEHVNQTGNATDTYQIRFANVLYLPFLNRFGQSISPTPTTTMTFPLLFSGVTLASGRNYEVIGSQDRRVTITRDPMANPENPFSLVTINAGATPVWLYGLKLTHADRSGAAGGAVNNAGNLFVANCEFRDNTALEGAAINSTGMMVVGGSHFEQNHGGTHGAIQVAGNSVSWITGTTFVANDSGSNGGAIALRLAAVLDIDNCQFANNQAKNGGAIYASSTNAQRSLTVTSSSLTNNTATSDGGAVYGSSVNARFNQCQFGTNSAGKNGGGIHQKLGVLLVDNCGLFAGNTAAGPAGAHHICDQGGATITTSGSTNATIVAVP